MRTASDFDRPWPGEAATTNLFWAEQGAFEPAVMNIYLAGIKVIEGILDGWNSTFAKGVNATNYIGMPHRKSDLRLDMRLTYDR